MTFDIREHGSKDDPNYEQYHPDDGAPRPMPEVSSRPRGSRPSSSAWNAPYPREVQASIAAYSDLEYIPINRYLRTGELRGGSGSAPELIEHMRTALRPLPENVTLYRGTGRSAFPDYDFLRDEGPEGWAKKLNAHVGETVSDAAFFSTSAAQNTLFYLGAEIQLDLQVPQGTPSINTAGESWYGGEGEIILGPGTKWRIDRVEVVHGQSNRGTPPVRVYGTVVP